MTIAELVKWGQAHPDDARRIHHIHVSQTSLEVVGWRFNRTRTDASHFVNNVVPTERRCHVAHLLGHPDQDFKARPEFRIREFGNKAFLQAHLAKLVEALDGPADEKAQRLAELASCTGDYALSHRCHNKHCIRASHLAVMSRHHNQQASRCTTAFVMNCGETVTPHVDEDYCSSPCALHHPGSATCLV